MKAYLVNEKCDNEVELIFAETVGQAKADYVNAWGCDFIDVRASRIKKFDGYECCEEIPICCNCTNADFNYECYYCKLKEDNKDWDDSCESFDTNYPKLAGEL